MSVLIAIGIFLVVLFVLVLVHEWGHYIVAKLTGMRVDEFAVGFPPTIWSRTIGETRYALNALPIGGYVKILGEDGDETATPLSEADRARTFGARPKWAQALVLLAGVTMNMLLAWVLLIVIAASLIGGERAVSEADYTGTNARLFVAEVLEDSPAAGKIPAGAYITAVIVEGEEMSLNRLTPTRFSEVVSEAGGMPVVVTYEFSEEVRTVTLVPESRTTEGEDRVVVGVSLALLAPVEYGLIGAIAEGTMATIDWTKRVTVGIFTFFGDILMGQADFSTVAGPVGLVGYVGDAAAQGVLQLLFFTALISINLAVINLLPIPALDGGRLVLVAVETVLRKPLSPVLAGRANAIGVIFLIALMIAVTVSDVWKLFS